MIIARIMGGMGNQLFGYAAARRLALTNGIELIIDDVSGFAYDRKYNRRYQLDRFSIPCRKATPHERLEPFSRGRRYVKRMWNRRLPFERRQIICQEKIDFDPRLLHVEPYGTLYLEGYWQSEKYFADVEQVIRNDLRILPPDDDVNLEIAERIRECPSVAVHVRFFDSAGLRGANNAPADYYARAFSKMLEFVPDAHYFVFSDRPNDARAMVPLPEDAFTLIDHNRGDGNAYADLWLMTHCQHFIIANSTFSWWGAWLASNPEKRIIAPGFVSREGESSWGFGGLIPDDWIKC